MKWFSNSLTVALALSLLNACKPDSDFLKEKPETFPKYTERLTELENENYFESLMGYPWPDIDLSDLPVFGKNPYIAKDFHPNNMGHKKYYDMVIKPMLQKDL